MLADFTILREAESNRQESRIRSIVTEERNQYSSGFQVRPYFRCAYYFFEDFHRETRDVTELIDTTQKTY